MMSCSVNGLGINYSLGKQYVGDFPPQENKNDLVYRPSQTCPNTIWDFWEKIYYPEVIKVGYPVYLQERAMDKGTKAYELLKVLIDKKIVKLDKVSDFVEAMDALIKAL